MNKWMLIIIVAILLTACDDPNCTSQWVNQEPERHDKIFELCLSKATEAFANRTDARGFDLIIFECNKTANRATTSKWITTCTQPVYERNK